MEISSGNIENISRAARVINGGGIVAFPTETVYGLGADALNPLAVSRIFEAKGRPYFDPLIVHIADISWLERLSFKVPPQAMVLARRFWPGPLTLVLKKTGMVPDIVTAQIPSVSGCLPSGRLDLIGGAARSWPRQAERSGISARPAPGMCSRRWGPST